MAEYVQVSIGRELFFFFLMRGVKKSSRLQGLRNDRTVTSRLRKNLVRNNLPYPVALLAWVTRRPKGLAAFRSKQPGSARRTPPVALRAVCWPGTWPVEGPGVPLERQPFPRSRRTLRKAPRHRGSYCLSLAALLGEPLKTTRNANLWQSDCSLVAALSTKPCSSVRALTAMSQAPPRPLLGRLSLRKGFC